MACLFFISKITIDYLTASLNFLPAENAGTVLAAIFNSLPVCGFLPILAALFLASNVPKPTKVSRLGEIQQIFKCKNSAILCKVSAKERRKVQEKPGFVQFEIVNF